MVAKQITLGGKALDHRDEYGDWGVHTLEGWWDSPAAKGEEVPLPNADGDYNLPVHYEARYVTATGIYIADSEARMFHGMNRFSALLAAPSRLHVVGYGASQWADVVRTSQNVITPVTDTVCKWQLKMKARDPRKYGDTAQFPLSGSYTNLFHRGSYLASPMVTVTGNAPGGYTIQEPGGVQYQVTGPLNPGQTHTIDFRTGVFRINGYIINGQTGVTDIWYIEPGVAKGMRVTSAGVVNATATVVDTFI